MEELDLKELAKVFWSKKVYIALITSLFIVLGIIYSFFFIVPKYESYTSLLLANDSNITSTDGVDTQNSITQTDIQLNQNLISTYSELIESKNVLREVISILKTLHPNANLDYITEDYLRNNIDVSYVRNTELIKISVQDENSMYAKDIANTIADVFIQRVNEIYNINNVHIIDEAEVEENPANINYIRDVAIFILIGLVVSAIIVLIQNAMNPTIKKAEDIEKIIKIPVLAEIPRYSLERRGKKYE